MKKTICLLPGDGIGPEIVAQGVAVLEAVAKKFGHEFDFVPALIGGAAIEDGDKLLTLSTCCTLYDKVGTGDQRLVVAAKLLPTAAEEAPYAVQDAKFPELPENK